MRTLLSARTLAALCVAAALPLHATATTPTACQAASGPRTMPLVELYTSEGCDSCPPADRWLAQSFPRTGDARAIALAFHVDYWDRLGWTDRFAAAAWTARQYAAMRANADGFVYTPQVLLQGHDRPSLRRGGADGALDAIAQRPPRAAIELAVVPVEGAWRVRARGRVEEALARSRAVLAVAYVDSGLVSDVKGGENRGARLTHDHVVRALESSGPASDGRVAVDVTLRPPAEAGRDAALVAFVQDPVTGDVLQALRLPLADCRR